MVSLKALRAFCLVMERGSILAATRELNLSAPAVSRLVSGLENEVGLRLFERGKRNLEPTLEGAEFYREASRVVFSASGLSDVARSIREMKAGHLRIIATARLAFTVVGPAVKAFCAAHPSANISVEIHARRDMTRWMAARHFDLGVVGLPISAPGVETESVISARGVAVLPPNHAKRAFPFVESSDLKDLPYIRMLPDTLMQQQIEAVVQPPPDAAQSHLSVSQALLSCMLVSQGLGWTLMDPLVPKLLGSAAVATVPFAPQVKFELGLMWPAGTARSSAAIALADIVKTTLRGLLETKEIA